MLFRTCYFPMIDDTSYSCISFLVFLEVPLWSYPSVYSAVNFKRKTFAWKPHLPPSNIFIAPLSASDDALDGSSRVWRRVCTWPRLVSTPCGSFIFLFSYCLPKSQWQEGCVMFSRKSSPDWNLFIIFVSSCSARFHFSRVRKEKRMGEGVLNFILLAL